MGKGGTLFSATKRHTHTHRCHRQDMEPRAARFVGSGCLQGSLAGPCPTASLSGRPNPMLPVRRNMQRQMGWSHLNPYEYHYDRGLVSWFGRWHLLHPCRKSGGTMLGTGSARKAVSANIFMLHVTLYILPTTVHGKICWYHNSVQDRVCMCCRQVCISTVTPKLCSSGTPVRQSTPTAHFTAMLCTQ